MRTKKYLVPVVMSLAVASCAKPPQADIAAARMSLDSARAAESAEYAPQALTAAEDAMAKLEAEIQAQQGRFFMFRSYDQAKLEAVSAADAARRATSEAVVAKERARSESSDLLARASTMLNDATQLLAVAPVGKGTAMDIAALKADLQTASQTLQEAQRAFDAGRYKEASAKATGAVAAIEGVRGAIEQARQARTRRS